ncbi:MAG: diguanylate cyclase [Thermodesulfobacterium sp.]|nr:diguanylate cyclase [Thermodesulfobacterium sp.]
MGEIEALLKNLNRELPPFPEVGVKILQNLLFKEERELFEFLNTEEELWNFIISVSNLPKFRKASPPIEDLRKAFLVLGDDLIKNLLLGYISLKIRKETFDSFSFPKFWARAILNLSLSHLLSSLLTPYPFHLHVASFLMDFGIVVLYLISPEGYLKVLSLKSMGKDTLSAEKEVFGFTHPEVSAEYLENFSLPRRLILDLYYHHYPLEDLPEEVPFYILEDLKILKLIDYGVGAYFGKDREENYENFKNLAKLWFNLDERENFKLIETLPAIGNLYFEIFKLEEFFLIPYSKWLEEKEREIKKITEELQKEAQKGAELLKSYEREIYKLWKEKENLLNQIKITEKKLKEVNPFHELTGLYNEGYFKKRLKEEILRAKRYKRILSVLLVNLEDLEELIKKFDFSVEDTFLKKLSQNLLKNLRRVDIIAHFKDPSFLGIILPETPSSGAVVVARKILKVIETVYLEVFKEKKSAFISILTYDSAHLDPKKEPSVEIILKLLNSGLNLLKNTKQSRFLVLRLDRELESR